MTAGPAAEVLGPRGASTTRPRKRRSAGQPSGGPKRSVVLIGQVAVALALVGSWHVVATQGLIDPVLAKTPAQTWDFFWTAWGSGDLMTHTQATMTAVLIAWVLASLAGVVVGIALGLLPTIERIVNPFFDAVNAMPRIALAPLFIVIFGINTTAKVALAFTLVFFIVCSSARAGVKATDGEWLRLSSALDASKLQVFRKIMLPVAVPAIFSGLRLGLIYALLGVVGSELISSRDGLGQLVSIYSTQFRMEGVYAILILLALIATVMNQVMNIAERYFLRWQPPASY